MHTKSLKSFQEEAVDSGVSLFAATKKLLDAAGDDVASRAAAINHNGYLLIEAPTGSGKTLMAGTIVERFSHVEEVVWFWFAPFKGVVGQTAAFLREQFHGLRLRELADDRNAAPSRRGDVFATTWQAVATRVKDKRNVRKEGDTNPSIDTLIDALRSLGLRIGVVVDEAHHSFGRETQAAKFFRDVLRPEYTILITATPDDADVKEFEKSMNIAELQRIRVGRMDVVDAGLIKTGVKCVAYFADADKKALIDLQEIALRDGVRAHRTQKKELAGLKIPLVPLLLVQATDNKSIEKMKALLLRLGFTDQQIAVHTAEEPDSGLLALANDEQREVLIFKMAVALGFDAPRAFTLVSLRASRDPDFGVQLVGRILRVHRRLQGRAQSKKLPASLGYGYVFLADAETQTGLDLAGQRINQIQTEYAKASTATVVQRYGDGKRGVAVVDASGQLPLFPMEDDDQSVRTTDAEFGAVESPEDAPASQSNFDFDDFFGISNDGPPPIETKPVGVGPTRIVGPVGEYRYPLRTDVPRRFKTQVVSGNNEVTEEDCAHRFLVSTRELFEVTKNSVPVERRELEVFTREIQKQFNFSATLSASQAAKLAQDALLLNKTFDPRELRRALLRKVEAVLRDEAMAEADDPEQVKHFLDVILATHPELLHQAQKEALAKHAEVQDTEDLLAEITSPEPLVTSLRNVYGIMPLGLNSWEQQFAELLDRDGNRVVSWWHRNLPHKPWSVNVLMPDGRGFYPDFVIGINGRKTTDHALLADPKLNYQRDDEAVKVLAEHGCYGRVLILFLNEGHRWMTVGYDQIAKKPVLAREFRLVDAAGF